eukprot:TRINITY_DN17331_c0_g1_i1.p1 TRINITY_DN17331_c0_g1~~TRINITY_DN17331_c0_g1_i1.p1  ORF type:complete len:729 (-),score=244.37 TRINITY_DN17331_c0_g1_i1:259-2445(-)
MIDLELPKELKYLTYYTYNLSTQYFKSGSYELASTIVILRLLHPALLNPNEYSLLQENKEIQSKTFNKLIFLAKLFQNLATEGYGEDNNSEEAIWKKENKQKFDIYFRNICIYENDENPFQEYTLEEEGVCKIENYDPEDLDKIYEVLYKYKDQITEIIENKALTEEIASKLQVLMDILNTVGEPTTKHLDVFNTSEQETQRTRKATTTTSRERLGTHFKLLLTNVLENNNPKKTLFENEVKSLSQKFTSASEKTIQYIQCIKNLSILISHKKFGVPYQKTNLDKSNSSKKSKERLYCHSDVISWLVNNLQVNSVTAEKYLEKLHVLSLLLNKELEENPNEKFYVPNMASIKKLIELNKTKTITSNKYNNNTNNNNTNTTNTSNNTNNSTTTKIKFSLPTDNATSNDNQTLSQSINSNEILINEPKSPLFTRSSSFSAFSNSVLKPKQSSQLCSGSSLEKLNGLGFFDLDDFSQPDPQIKQTLSEIIEKMKEKEKGVEMDTLHQNTFASEEALNWLTKELEIDDLKASKILLGMIKTSLIEAKNIFGLHKRIAKKVSLTDNVKSKNIENSGETNSDRLPEKSPLNSLGRSLEKVTKTDSKHEKINSLGVEKPSERINISRKFSDSQFITKKKVSHRRESSGGKINSPLETFSSRSSTLRNKKNSTDGIEFLKKNSPGETPGLLDKLFGDENNKPAKKISKKIKREDILKTFPKLLVFSEKKKKTTQKV